MHGPTLDTLAADPRLRRQHRLLLRLRDRLQDEPACLGAAVCGSLADGRGDSLSDVDLVVYCEAGAASGLLERLAEAAVDRPVVHRLCGRHDRHSVFEKLILDDWSSFELHVVEPTTRMRLRPPYIELLDRDDTLAGRRSPDKPIGRDTLRPDAHGDDGLVWELFNCIKWLRRGDTAFTRLYLQALGRALEQRGAPDEDPPTAPPPADRERAP